MIREINVKELTENISEMCIQANHYLSPDMDTCMKQAVETEKSELGKKILNQLQENLEIADKEMIPICQDTGMAVIFMEIGQDVHFVGGDFEEAINEGVRRGYVDGYLRKSVVKDPLIRENTKDNPSQRISTNTRNMSDINTVDHAIQQIDELGYYCGKRHFKNERQHTLCT